MDEQREVANNDAKDIGKQKKDEESEKKDDIRRSESPDDFREQGSERDFDFDSIYGERGSGDLRQEKKEEESQETIPEGWGPPMANVLVSGLPQSKHDRGVVKSTLREELSKYGKIVGLNWGNRKGSCFIGMDSPLSASTAIAHLHEKSFVFTKINVSTKLKLRLDMEQGFKKPEIDMNDSLSLQQQLLLQEEGGGGGEGGNMPVSFTSRHGKWNDNMEMIREKKWMEDKLCWCSICNSKQHIFKECGSDVLQYHQKVVLGYLVPGEPIDDAAKLFGALPPDLEEKRIALFGHDVIAESSMTTSNSYGFSSSYPNNRRKDSYSAYGSGGGGGGGKGGGWRGGKGRKGGKGKGGKGGDDWSCESCGNLNWGRRNECNRCGYEKGSDPSLPAQLFLQQVASWNQPTNDESYHSEDQGLDNPTTGNDQQWNEGERSKGTYRNDRSGQDRDDWRSGDDQSKRDDRDDRGGRDDRRSRDDRSGQDYRDDRRSRDDRSGRDYRDDRRSRDDRSGRDYRDDRRSRDDRSGRDDRDDRRSRDDRSGQDYRDDRSGQDRDDRSGRDDRDGRRSRDDRTGGGWSGNDDRSGGGGAWGKDDRSGGGWSKDDRSGGGGGAWGKDDRSGGWSKDDRSGGGGAWGKDDRSGGSWSGNDDRSGGGGAWGKDDRSGGSWSGNDDRSGRSEGRSQNKRNLYERDEEPVSKKRNSYEHEVVPGRLNNIPSWMEEKRH